MLAASEPITVPSRLAPAHHRGEACCPPLLREPISASQAITWPGYSRPWPILIRLRLVSMVGAHEGGEACVCDLTEPLGLTQPTISHHLKILVDAGIFARDKRGVWAYYSLIPEAINAVSTDAERQRLTAMMTATWPDWSHQPHPWPDTSARNSMPGLFHDSVYITANVLRDALHCH